MSSLPPGLARTIARFHFARDLLGREKSRCRRPELGDLARLASHAAHPLGIAAIAVAERDAAVVAIADRDFAGVGHRTDKSGCDPEDLIAHRHQVDRAPQAPEAPVPVLHSAQRRTILREGLQNIGNAIEPRAGPAVDRIGEDDDRELLTRIPAGRRDVALQAAAVAEPVPAVGCAARRAEPVITSEAGIWILSLAADHLAATRRRDHAFARSRRELGEIVRDIGRGADHTARGRDGSERSHPE